MPLIAVMLSIDEVNVTVTVPYCKNDRIHTFSCMREQINVFVFVISDTGYWLLMRLPITIIIYRDKCMKIKFIDGRNLFQVFRRY